MDIFAAGVLVEFCRSLKLAKLFCLSFDGLLQFISYRLPAGSLSTAMLMPEIKSFQHVQKVNAGCSVIEMNSLVQTCSCRPLKLGGVSSYPASLQPKLTVAGSLSPNLECFACFHSFLVLLEAVGGLYELQLELTCVRRLVVNFV